MTETTHAFCGLTVIPVRAETSDASEMITQLLFGEALEIIDEKEQWRKIRSLCDHYEGWVDGKQLLPIASETAQQITSFPRQQEPVSTLYTPWGKQTLLQGSPLFSFKETFIFNDYPFHWVGNVPSEQNKTLGNLVNSYLNAPYLWGGRTKFGIDCSGFSQTIMQQLAHPILRDASQQFNQGRKIPFAARKEGDLAFFSSEGKENISHVGIVLPHHKIIHAHGRVRIDTLNESGIFNEKEKIYSHQLRGIRRFLEL